MGEQGKPSGPIEVRDGGARYALVARRDVHARLGEEAARRLLEDGLREHGRPFAWKLEELAQQLVGGGAGAGSGDGRSRDPVRVVIDALVAGRLVAVRWDAPVRLMSEPEYTDLQDLGRGDVDGPFVGGAPREPVPALRTTWLSFDVVDDRGEPLPAGRFGAAIDGRGEGGPLDAQRHRYDMLRESAAAALRLQDIVWPFEPGVTDDSALPLQPHPTRVVSLEVVDDQGVALLGRYVLTDSPDDAGEVVEVRGELGAVVHREITGNSPRLRLEGIVFPVAPAPSPPATE